MKLSEQIEEMQKKLLADIPDDVLGIITAANKKIIGNRLEKGALRVGQEMPVFQVKG